jgi:transposase-like protein
MSDRFTHDQRRQRRKDIASALGQGVSIARVCRRFGVTVTTARSALAEFAKPVRKPKSQDGLTHDQWRERRVEIARALRRGYPLAQVCEQFGVTVATARSAFAENTTAHQKQILLKRDRLLKLVKNLPLRQAARKVRLAPETALAFCEAAGITPAPSPNQRRRVDWESLDWTLRDAALARLVGVSRERVRQVRHTLGKARSPHHGIHASVVPFRHWAISRPEVVADYTVKQLAQRFSTSAITISRHLAELGIKPRPSPTPPVITEENVQSFCEIDPDSECWVMRGADGLVRRVILQHDVAYRTVFKWFCGPIGAGTRIIHTCGNPHCINPAHLEAKVAGTQ